MAGRFRGICLILFVLASVAATAAPTSVIVELRGEPAAIVAAKARAAGNPLTAEQIESHRATLAAAQQRLLAALGAKGVAYTVGGRTVANVRVDFAYTLVFNGINLLVDPSAIATIRAMPEVKAVHNDQRLTTNLDVSVPYLRATDVYGVVKEVSRFDDFREGYEGQGIYLSVIDTGVDWTHEMFGGDPTPPRFGVAPPVAAAGSHEKIVYYLPLADSVLEDAFGHGTHVAATAVGYLGFGPGPDGLPLSADDVRMHGVAPQARIMSYKVCSDAISTVDQAVSVGGCLESAITMAIEDSVSPRTVTGFPKPVAHVINMSLGGSGTPDSVTAVAADNAVRLGTTVVAAAGNSGPGELTAGAPCVGRLVTCVANSVDPHGSWTTDVLAPSSVNKLLPGAVTPAASLPAAAGQRQRIRLFPMSGTPDPPKGGLAQYYVYVAGGDTPLTFPASVRGRIALLEGPLTLVFAQAANSAAAAGAVALIFNSDVENATAGKGPIPSANISAADFGYLKQLVNGTPNPPDGAISAFPIRFNPFGKTQMNGTSSRGPVAGHGQVKPDVTAPGTNITAAVPPASLMGALSQSNYGSSSGTSMASPHVAGAAALIKQSHLSWTPDMIRTALLNTSTNLRDENGAPKPGAEESILDQGGGLIDVYEAVNIKALMGVEANDINLPSLLGSHSFGTVEAVRSGRVVTQSVQVALRDVSGSAGTYALSVINNRGIDMAGVSVTIIPSSVAVPANGRALFTVQISIDGNVVTSGAPIQLQWYVRATRTDGAEQLGMPFYLRATQKIPAAAAMNPVADDATADRENGIDRDGRYVVSWSYPASEPAKPCGYRIDEAQASASGTIYFDDAEEVMLPGGNSRWRGANWTSKPHPGTLTLGYAPIYLDERTVAITSAHDIALPQYALLTLSFDSFEDIELDFDYGFVDVSTDGGSTWSQVATYSGAFTGLRSVDISDFHGTNARIRFRLVSDQLVSTPAFQGWTIDNIRISAATGFTPLTTVAATTTALAIGGKQNGTYAYRAVALFGDCAANPFATTPSNVESVTVNNATRPPVAGFTSTPNPAHSGESITFDASASSDQDTVNGGGIVEYLWSFGDGSMKSTATPSTTHSYSAAGTYRVSLIVRDDDGESASAESLQTVREPNATISGGGSVPTSAQKSNFSIDVLMSNGVPSGNMQWHDVGAKMKVKSTRITRVERSGTTATVFGDCTVNKNQSSTFVMELTDGGASDQVTMRVGDGYVATGTVSGGDVIVRE